MQGLTCICLLLVLLLATWGVEGVSHDKLANSRVNKLRARVSSDKVKAKTTIATSARAQKRGVASQQPAPTTLLQQRTTAKQSQTVQQKTKAKTQDTPTSTIDMSSWATSPTQVTATPLVDQPSGELSNDASASQILQAYKDVSSRVDDLESGQRDAVWNRADIASAQDQATRIIQSAQDALAQEQAQNAAMSALEVSAKKDTKETKKTEDTQTTDESAETEVEVEADPADSSPCCTNAKDSVARTGADTNTKTLSDLKAQVTQLTDEITKATSPPTLDPAAFNQENSAVLANNGEGTVAATGGTTTAPPGPTSTGSAAQCNTHLNKDTLKGDPNIWKEEDQAKLDAMNKLIDKVAPQFTTGMATDAATFTKTDQLIVDNDAKNKDFKSQLATSCAEATCDLGASGGLLVQADTPNSP